MEPIDGAARTRDPDLRPRIRRRSRLGTAIALGLLVSTTTLAGDPSCLQEQEPNGEPPPPAIPSLAPGACLEGSLAAADDRDLFPLVVPPGGARLAPVLEGARPAWTHLRIYRPPDQGWEGRGRPVEVDTLSSPPGTDRLEALPVWLPEGSWVVAVGASGPAGDYRFRLTRSGPPSALADRTSGPFAGLVEVPGKGTRDLSWTPTAATPARLWNLSVEAPWSPRDSGLALQILDAKRRVVLAAPVPTQGLRRNRLRMPEGPLTLSLRNPGKDPLPVLLDLGTGPEATSDQEAEPDDAPGDAVPLSPGVPVEGDLVAGDLDFFRIGIPRPAADELRLSVLSTSGRALRACLMAEDGRKPLRCLEGDALRTRLSLPSGLGLVKLDADRPTGYRIEVSAGPAEAPAFASREPDDRPALARPLGKAGFVAGTFEGEDVDHHLLEVDSAARLWRIQVQGEGVRKVWITGPEGAEILAASHDGSPGLVRLRSLYLLPATYVLGVAGKDGAYRLRALSVGPVRPDIEREPNDQPGVAERIGISTARHGILDRADDVDMFRFRVGARRRIRLHLDVPEGGKVEASLEWGLDRRGKPIAKAEVGPGGSDLESELWPGDYLIRLAPLVAVEGEYRLELIPAPLFPEPTTNLGPGDLAVTLGGLPVFASSAHGAQSTGAQVVLTDRSGKDREVRLEAAVTDDRIMLATPEVQVRLSAGGTASVTLPLVLEPELVAGPLGELAVRAQAGSGATSIVTAAIAADGEAPTVGPRPWRPFDAALLGALDVARSGMGGRIAGEDRDRQLLAPLFDDVVQDGAGVSFVMGRVPNLEVRTPGDLPVTIVGFALHPLARGAVEDRTRRFAVEVSEDGVGFRTALEGELLPVPREQFFRIEPTPVRAVRLRLKENHGGTRISLGGFKVLAAPDERLFGSDGPDLANPALGGHVAWSKPQVSALWDGELLSPEAENHWFRLGPDGTWDFALTFWNQRAARIHRLEWTHPADAKGHKRVSRVKVQSSLGGPLGPWADLGEWNLAGAAGSTVVWNLPRSLWARSLRFRTESPGANAVVRTPARIGVFEEPVDEDYRSILGEWGLARREAYLEELRDAEATAISQISGLPVAPPDLDADHPWVLPAEANAWQGEVRVGTREAWVAIPVPADRDELRARVIGTGSFRPALEVRGQDGRPRPCTGEEDAGDPAAADYRCPVEPGATARVRIHEPPRSVVVAWDTSASVTPHRAAIWRALDQFSQGLSPGREVANLLPFGAGKPLLERWAETPDDLRRALGSYDHGHNSSAAEETLAVAGDALAGRAGKRAVVLVTDAATTRSSRVWSSLERSRAQVFEVGLGSEAAVASRPLLERNLLQSWAAAGGGRYDFLRSQGDMDAAFERAVAALRSSLPYRVEVELVATRPPQPGLLEVVVREPEPSARPALAIVLDASGSMFKIIEGETRIAIARRVLGELIEKELPPGLPVALRAFGHREERSCRTDLEIPLGPLDPAGFMAKVRGIVPQAYSKTPLAASIQAVRRDLQGAGPGSRLVLITDGEETCEGDPAAAVASLRASGLDVSLSIVGFALDSGADRERFSAWAKAGGGAYSDAADAKGLKAGLSRAVRMPYRVLAGGKEVARGEVGGAALPLPPGEYRVVAGARQATAVIRAGKSTRVELP